MIVALGVPLNMPVLEPSLPLARVRVYSLPEVAQMTRVSLGQLQEDCRAGLITHFHRGRTVGMLLAHIEEFVAEHTRTAKRVDAKTDEEIVIEMSRRNARRATPRRRAS